MHWRVVEKDEDEVKDLVKVWNVKEGVVLPLVWENPDVMVYVNSGAKYLDARRFVALPSHGRPTIVVYTVRSITTVYKALHMRQEERGIVEEHAVEGTDIPVLRDASEAVYVSNLAMFARDIEADQYLEDWLRYCMLPWSRHKLPFLEGSNVRRDSTKFERRHWTEAEGSYFVG